MSTPLIWPYRTDFDLYLKEIPAHKQRENIRYAYGCYEPHFPVPMIPIEFQWSLDRGGKVHLTGWDISREVGTPPEYKINSYGG